MVSVQPVKPSYSRFQTAAGLVIAILTGVVLLSLMLSYGRVIDDMIAALLLDTSPQPDVPPLGQRMAGAQPPDVRDWNNFTLFAIVGTPIALIIGVPVGLSVFRKVQLQHDHRVWRFTMAGALSALLISVIGTVLITAIGFQQSLDDSDYSLLSAYGHIMSEDGIKTPFGWFVELYTTVRFVIIGAISGTAARLAIGPPRSIST